MSNRKAKTATKPVEQAVPAETPETVEDQAVQAESETAAEAAVQPTAPAETHENPAPAIPKRPQIVAADSRGLNLRKGPHVSYDVITVLPDGTPVEILDIPADVKVPGWALVKTGADIGWVNTNFLTEAEA